MPNVTELLVRWGKGDHEAFDRVVPVLYRELKQLAHSRLRSERPGHTLNTTGLVHEAYLRLVDVDRVEWSDRNHFLAMAARTMRRVLIDHARAQAALKRGGRAAIDASTNVTLVGSNRALSLMALDQALEGLEKDHPRQSKALELLYFGGLNQTEVGAVLGVSQPTVARDLRFARAWLAGELDGA